MKVHDLQIIDQDGDVVLTFDGNVQGGQQQGALLIDPYHHISWPLLAASVDNFIWICHAGIWQVAYASSIIAVSGGSGATVQVRVGDAATAVASATAQLSAALDLEETAPNKQVGAVIASPTQIFPGMVVSADFSGTLTGLVGLLTVTLKRVG